MRKLNFKELSIASGGKFIGAERRCGPCYQGAQDCHRSYYVFWIKIHQASMTEPC